MANIYGKISPPGEIIGKIDPPGMIDGHITPPAVIYVEMTPSANIKVEMKPPTNINVKLQASGPKGEDYVLTEEDKEEIAAMVEEKDIDSITKEQIYSLFSDKEEEENNG